MKEDMKYFWENEVRCCQIKCCDNNSECSKQEKFNHKLKLWAT